MVPITHVPVSRSFVINEDKERKNRDPNRTAKGPARGRGNRREEGRAEDAPKEEATPTPEN